MCSTRFATLASFAAAGIFTLSLATPAHAQVSFGVRVGSAPPPLRYERRPPAPGPGYAWVDGYYDPYNGGYRWHPRLLESPALRGRLLRSSSLGSLPPTAGISTKATGPTKTTTRTIGTTTPH